MKKLLIVSKAADPFYYDEIEKLGVDMSLVATCGNIGGILSYAAPNESQIALLEYDVVDNSRGFISHEEATRMLRSINPTMEIVVLAHTGAERADQLQEIATRLK